MSILMWLGFMEVKEKVEDDDLYDKTIQPLKSFMEEELIWICRYKGLDNVLSFPSLYYKYCY